jgi:hypothetical protein
VIDLGNVLCQKAFITCYTEKLITIWTSIKHGKRNNVEIQDSHNGEINIMVLWDVTLWHLSTRLHRVTS